MRPLPSLPVAGALLAAGALTLPAGASAAGVLKVPVPAPGQVSVAAAALSGPATLVAPRHVPAGSVVTGGGAGRVALVAVIRPDDGAKAAKGGVLRVTLRGRGKPRGVASSARVFGDAVPAGLAGAVKPSCSRAAGALARALRHSGSDGLGAGDLKRIGRAIAARLCGGKVDAGTLTDAGLAAPAATPAGTPGPGVGGASGAPSVRPPAAGGSPTPPPTGSAGNPGGGGGGAPACSNGKDDDGDGQVDDLGQGAQFFDPGCSSPQDTSENSEKATPRQCGIGVYLTNGSTTTFGVDYDSLSFGDCPKQMTHGVVDLGPLVTACSDPGFEGQAAGSCTVTSGDAVLTGGQGDQWQLQGTANASLCGSRAVIVGYTADGQAWEQDGKVVDPGTACAGGGGQPGAAQCNDGVDNDGDGQIDAAGGGGKGPDPGCADAADTTEASETSFPTTGCVPVVAPDPNDATLAYVFVIRTSGDNDSCPTISEEWISFDDLQVQSCHDGPYWDGTAAGSCAVSGGDAHLTGASGTRSLVVLKLSGAIDCNVQGQVDERDALSIGEGSMIGGYFDTDNNNQLTLC